MMSMSVVVNMAVLIMAVVRRSVLRLCDIMRLRVSRRSSGAGRRFSRMRPDALVRWLFSAGAACISVFCHLYCVL